MGGWLSKQSRHMRDWRRRWCVLTPQYFLTFKTQGIYTKPTEVIRIREISMVKSADEQTGKENAFRLDTPGQIFYIIADSAPEKEAWIGSIGRQIVRTERTNDDY